MTAKNLLLHQTRLVFDADAEMSLKASIEGITEESARAVSSFAGMAVEEIFSASPDFER